MLGSGQCAARFWVWFFLVLSVCDSYKRQDKILFGTCIRFYIVFKAIQFILWFISAFSSGSVWVENGSKLSVISMATKCVGSVHDIYTIPSFCYLVTKCVNGQ